MSEHVQSVLDRAMQLSDADRGEVAAQLLASLDPPPDSDIELAWADEIQQRIDDVRAGRSMPTPWEVARSQMLEEGDDAGGCVTSHRD